MTPVRYIFLGVLVFLLVWGFVRLEIGRMYDKDGNIDVQSNPFFPVHCYDEYTTFYEGEDMEDEIREDAYFYKKHVLFEINESQKSAHVVYRALYRWNEGVYAWGEGPGIIDDPLYIESYRLEPSDYSVSSNWRCRIWWSPSQDIFTVPSHLDFKTPAAFDLDPWY